IMRRELAPEAIETICLYLSLIFSIESLTSKDLRKAAQMRNKDFEDSLQMVCAEKISADYIVTRNIKDFALSKVPVITPAEFLNIMQKENDNN
ncbi:MAG: PIN domain-containing protein, partial [Clostridiales bacterium]|nr:PIN domain-containing protein [Clostridiales bacterium]